MRVRHDTPSAGTLESDTVVHVSRSEIEALCMKAARGAGLTWGLAEEAGMAARRLSEAGLPGPEWLLAYLEGQSGGSPIIDGRHWRPADDGGLCPIATGAALSDFAGHHSSLPILHGVRWSGLLLPFLMRVSAAERAIRLDWGAGSALAGVGGILAPQEPPIWSDVVLSEVSPPGWPQRHAGRSLSHALWRRLDALALRTTVPATEQSRAGAGAGIVDQD